MTQDRFPASGLRVGHAERDAIAAILQEAAADGRLGMDELDERLGVALQAKTYGDLEPLVADLSVELPWRSSGRALAPVPGPPPIGYTAEDPLRLDGGVSSEKRDGAWVVPPFLRISSGVGSVKLNCLRATPAAPVIDVEVIAGAGTVVIIVPAGWAVNDDRLGKSMGTKSIKVARTPAPGQPLLVLRGSVGMGTLKVRPPSKREERRAVEER
ncbi:MAG TPA: DUF1707 domain-containing protein [Microlunatus sp.]|jgi:hypothetical protein|nr:DUF1707 domain-containing protein [Microlunatus sp.]